MLLAAALLAVSTLSGCGSGSNSGGNTPPGTYTITVNGVAGTDSHTYVVTLIVQ